MQSRTEKGFKFQVPLYQELTKIHLIYLDVPLIDNY